MEIINQVLTSANIAILTIGVLLLVIAVNVGIFKKYPLVVGFSLSERELKKIDLGRICKTFGKFTCISSFTFIVSPFIFICLDMKHEWRFWFIFCGGFFFAVGYMILYAGLKKGGTYIKKVRRNLKK